MPTGDGEPEGLALRVGLALAPGAAVELGEAVAPGAAVGPGAAVAPGAVVDPGAGVAPRDAPPPLVGAPNDVPEPPHAESATATEAKTTARKNCMVAHLTESSAQYDVMRNDPRPSPGSGRKGASQRPRG